MHTLLFFVQMNVMMLERTDKTISCDILNAFPRLISLSLISGAFQKIKRKMTNKVSMIEDFFCCFRVVQLIELVCI